MELEELWQPTLHETDAQEFLLALESVRIDHPEVMITGQVAGNSAENIARYYREHGDLEKAGS